MAVRGPRSGAPRRLGQDGQTHAIPTGICIFPSMEPSSTEPRAHGRAGSLTNPEVVENVPGHIIPILEHEFDDFDSEAGKFLAGDTPEDQFIGFRLKQGVYGQRQANVQMVRVKLPFGGINPEQMDAFADVTERYAPLNKSHITTRQNIQIHHVPLDQMTKLIREISAVGLSSREGCGNTVRNVTADPLAGICEDEVFDPTPYVGAYVRYFVRHPTTQLMPRKVKTAFDGTPTSARSPASTTSPSSRVSATACAGSRCASAAARRSCRASPRRSSTSSPPTTAST